jgi:hypothetical protein
MTDTTRKQSVFEICKRVLASSGLPVPTAIAGNPDALAVQLLALLNEEGQDLLQYNWKFLEKTYALATVPGTLEYSLPSDFDRWLADTDWNTTTRLPLVQMDSRQWAVLNATTLGSTTFQLQYQLTGDKIRFYQVPSTAQNLQIAYRSRGWVATNTGSTYKDNADANDDIVQYNSNLMVACLKHALRREKGFDTTATKEKYEAALASALNAEILGETLYLRAPRGGLIDTFTNLPETGLGS